MSSVSIQGNASGTGIFTIASPNSNTNRTLTLPDNTGTVLTTGSTFGSTGPAFSAYADTAQTITASTWTKVTFGVEEFDTNSNFASSRFTPTVAGYYQFNAQVLCKASSTLSAVSLTFYKNGAGFTRSFGMSISSGEPAISGSCLIYLNGSTDYVEVYGFINGTGTITFGFNDTAITSRFSGFLARAT
jgi:hypothetical protein